LISEETTMLKETGTLLLCAALVTTGCASAPRQASALAPRQGSGQAPRQGSAQAAPAHVDTATMSEYVQKLPAGSRVRVEQSNGQVIKGTLMKATADEIVVQKNTRNPETPVTIPTAQIARVTLDSGSSTGKTVGIAVATGVGATFGVLLLLAALLGGD
jgi:hypothetical protein